MKKIHSETNDTLFSLNEFFDVTYEQHVSNDHHGITQAKKYGTWSAVNR